MTEMCRRMMPGMAAPGHECEPINIRILIDSVPALVHRARPDGYLDDLNKRCLEHLGRSLEQVEAGDGRTQFILMRLREFSARGAPAGQGLRNAFSSESLPPCSCGPTVLLALRQTPSQKDGNPSTHACGRALDLRPRHGATFRAHNDPGAERLRSILRPLSR